MNPIENLWGYLVCKLNKARTEREGPFHARDARNADQLYEFVNRAWTEVNDIGAEYREALINSMPKRLQAVIDQNGGWTGY